MAQARINDGLARLVEHYLADQDEKSTAQTLEICKRLLEREDDYISTGDVEHISDLIKRRLIRDKASPDAALRYSNLFSRLQAQPVLSNKFAILSFLNALTNSASESPSTAPLQDQFSYMGLHSIPPLPQSQTDLPPLPQPPSPSDDHAPLQTKAALIASNRPAMEPSERELLRDIPYLLLGLPSTHFPLQERSLMLPSTLPAPVISLLYSLAEPGLLYKSLQNFIATEELLSGDDQVGLVGQSLRGAVKGELSGWMNLVAGIESEIRRFLSSSPDSSSGGVTLKRVAIWVREGTLGLRLMSVIIEDTNGLKGGQLIDKVHSFTSHGDPYIRSFAHKLLLQITKPWYEMLRTWIYSGVLQDPFQEFFVRETAAPEIRSKYPPYASSAGMPKQSTWEGKYTIEESLVPGFMGEGVARKVFLIGKSLNFIRGDCGEEGYVIEHAKEASLEELSYGNTVALEQSIDKAYLTTTSKLVDLMKTKFGFWDHLDAFKKYILLGQGDFIAILMESIGDSLDRPANSLYRHNLTATLESAIRSSNAQYSPPEILRRLDARMLELSHGEIGWDVFTLEYKVDAPLDVIVTPHCAREYLKVFNFLWRVKRVEFAITGAWKRQATGARGVLKEVEGLVGQDWRLVRGACGEMIHFLCQLQYYILFEVIESSWDSFVLAVSKPDCTLDTIITEHAKYLSNITHKGLLGGGRSGREGSLSGQLHEILKVIMHFKEGMDALYGYSVAEYARRQNISKRAAERTAAGEWGITSADIDPPAPTEDISQIRALLALKSREFRVMISVLLTDLAYQGDTEMRFLGIRLNYNEFYELVPRTGRRDRAKEKEAAKKRVPENQGIRGEGETPIFQKNS